MSADLDRQRRRRGRAERWFAGLCRFTTLATVAMLAVLLIELCRQGFGQLDWQFLTSQPSRFPSKAGILSALAGTVWVLVLTTLIVVPLGIAAAVYLEEFAEKNRLNTALEINIANLAGVPSIVYGMLGLAVFVRWMHLGRSVLAGALTLALLVLPVIIVAAREAIRAVPGRLRTGSLALGATRWQTTWKVVLPAATPGIATGVILAISRTMGETAPLIMMGALTYVPFVPTGLLSRFTVLPIQIYNWAAKPQLAFHALAASGIVVLMVILLAMNGVAVYVRYRAEKNPRW